MAVIGPGAIYLARDDEELAMLVAELNKLKGRPEIGGEKVDLKK